VHSETFSINSTYGIMIEEYTKSLKTAYAYDISILCKISDGTTRVTTWASDAYDRIFSDSNQNWGEPDNGNWHRAQLLILDGSQKIYIASTLEDTNTVSLSSVSEIHLNSKGQACWDWIFVRKYINPEPTHADWDWETKDWLTGFQYRKSHNIQGSSGGSQTNYQVKIKVHREDGSDSGGDVYVGTKCQSDFDDIRFTKTDGKTELDYYREKIDGNVATFWVEVDSIPASPNNATIYIYYGNSTVSTTSSGDDTFLLFDNFEDGSIDGSKWDTFGSPSETSGCLYASTNDQGWKGVRSDIGFGSNVILEYEVKYEGDVGGQGTGYHGLYPSAAGTPTGSGHAFSASVKQVGFGEGVCGDWQMGAHLADGSHGQFSYVGWNLNNHMTFNQIIWKGTSAYFHTEKTGSSFSTTLSNYPPSGNMDVFFGVSDINAAYGAVQMWVYWVRVRKYVDPQPAHGSWGREDQNTYLDADFYDDVMNGPVCLVDSVYSLDTKEKMVFSFETDSDYDYGEPIIEATIYHNIPAIYLEVDRSMLDSGRTIDIYLGTHQLWSNVVQGASNLTGWFNGTAYYNECRALRYTVRHGVQMGYKDAQTRQLLNRASRCKNMLDDYGFTYDIYDPMYFSGRNWPNTYFYTSQAYHDVDVYDQLPNGSNYYPYWSKVGIAKGAYIYETMIDPLARALQAVYILNKYGSPQYLYNAGPLITTPRETANYIIVDFWNGYGVSIPFKPKEYSSGLRTATFLVLETLLGYKYDDATHREYADKCAKYLIQTQWSESGWGLLETGGKACRPLHGGGFMVVYKKIDGISFGTPPAGILQDLVDLFSMPNEYDGLIPTNQETTFAVARALEVYLQYAFSSQGDHDITGDRFVLQGYMFKDTGASDIKYANVTLESGTYDVRVTARNWGDEYDRTVRLYVDGSQVQEWTANCNQDFDQTKTVTISSSGIHKIGLVIITSDYRTPDNWWVADVSIEKQ